MIQGKKHDKEQEEKPHRVLRRLFDIFKQKDAECPDTASRIFGPAIADLFDVGAKRGVGEPSGQSLYVTDNSTAANGQDIVEGNRLLDQENAQDHERDEDHDDYEEHPQDGANAWHFDMRVHALVQRLKDHSDNRGPENRVEERAEEIEKRRAQ